MMQTAQLNWSDGLPHSTSFGDVYFSRASGLEETRHVFLQGNRLPERFAALQAHQVFTIGETGFGTGLNFLCAWQCFRQHAPENARLSFVSVEKFPLTAADLQRALTLWPELASQAAELCARYIVPPLGWHRFVLNQGRVCLTLIIGDATTCLHNTSAQVDAWFLDGFSPAKNPEMWSEDLFNTIAHLSAPGASFATFTSAGFVRRALQTAGFSVEKTAGYGHKREMSHGIYQGRRPTSAWHPPWFAYPHVPTHTERHAVVIGGGIAGAASAWSLACRGWQVTLIERHAVLAREGSGNAQAILYARLSAHATPQTQLVLAGFRYSFTLLQQLFANQPDAWQQTGVLQLATDAGDHLKQQALLASDLAGDWIEWRDQQAASQLAGIALPTGGIFFPHAGWLHPPTLVAALCSHPNIEIKTETSALELSRSDIEGLWIVSNEKGPVTLGNVVVLAGGADSAAFDSTSHLPLTLVRGQITHLPATTASQALRTVVCQEGYITPAHHGLHSLGASFKLDADHLKLSDDEHQENLDMLLRMAPTLYQACKAQHLVLSQLSGRAAWRCTSPDYLPLIGPVAPLHDFVQTYASLSIDASFRLTEPAPWTTGLYINTAHGSRGMISAPLSGEVLAAQINNEPAPVSTSLMQALHPNRFPLRWLIHGKIDPAHYPS